MNIKVEEHSLQTLSNKHEEEKCFTIKGVLKDTARKYTLGRNHINVASVTNTVCVTYLY